MKTYDERYSAIVTKARKIKNRRRILSASCAGVIVTALLLVLFVPYNQTSAISRYQDSPYYPLIEKLDPVVNRQDHIYKNNYEAILGKLEDVFDPKSGSMMAPGEMLQQPAVNEGTNLPENDTGYVEVTDNQVAGVTEADVFKRTNTHIFHLFSGAVNVYTIDGENSRKIACVDIRTELQNALQEQSNEKFNISICSEMFLSADGMTLTVFCYAYRINQTYILNFDVSDPEKPTLSRQIVVGGLYNSSRMVDGKLLLATTLQYYSSDISFDKEETYVPQYGWGEELNNFPIEDIILPEGNASCSYQIYCILDPGSLELLDGKALLGGTATVFVSKNYLYATGYRRDAQSGNWVSDITVIRFADNTLEVVSKLTVEGRILNQYSMDEYNGSFRVVTTTQSERSANLYCFDTETWLLQGKVEQFAPKGEEVTSVRFEENYAYVCTARRIELTDPVFFFDLTDPANITWTDTGTIDGYSTSLVDFGNGLLVGIGVNENLTLKVEVYREGLEKVESLCSYERDCVFPETYKSYYIDRENQIIGMSIQDLITGEPSYIVLFYHAGKLHLAQEIGIPFYNPDNRACTQDGWMYILSSGITAVKLNYQERLLYGTVTDMFGDQLLEVYVSFTTEDGTRYTCILPNGEDMQIPEIGDRVRVFCGDVPTQGVDTMKIPEDFSMEILEATPYV